MPKWIQARIYTHTVYTHMHLKQMLVVAINNLLA